MPPQTSMLKQDMVLRRKYGAAGRCANDARDMLALYARNSGAPSDVVARAQRAMRTATLKCMRYRTAKRHVASRASVDADPAHHGKPAPAGITRRATVRAAVKMPCVRGRCSSSIAANVHPFIDSYARAKCCFTPAATDLPPTITLLIFVASAARDAARLSRADG